MSPRGPVCQVEGCGRNAEVDVFLGGGVDLSDVRLDNEEIVAALRVCRVHGDALGTVYDVRDGDPGRGPDPLLVVDVDIERAEGWRLVVIVRASGRHAVCLFPPEPS